MRDVRVDVLAERGLARKVRDGERLLNGAGVTKDGYVRSRQNLQCACGRKASCGRGSEAAASPSSCAWATVSQRPDRRVPALSRPGGRYQPANSVGDSHRGGAWTPLTCRSSSPWRFQGMVNSLGETSRARAGRGGVHVSRNKRGRMTHTLVHGSWLDNAGDHEDLRGLPVRITSRPEMLPSPVLSQASRPMARNP